MCQPNNASIEDVRKAEVETLRKLTKEQKKLLSECRDVFERYNHGIDCDQGEFSFIIDEIDNLLRNA